MKIQADLRQVVYALSDALDLVGIDDLAHGKRVGVMAAECAKVMGLPQEDVLFFFDLGLLHDIGVSNTGVHQHLVDEFDWADSQRHAIVGYDLLKDFAPLASMALPIRYHHSRWDLMLEQGVPSEIAQKANLVFLVDRVDALAAPYYAGGHILQHRKDIQRQILELSGSYFSATLVAAFMAASSHEAFWLRLESNALGNYLDEMLRVGQPYLASNAEFLRLAEIFSLIVDAKSPFTTTHSRGVAKVARRLAEYLNVSEDHCDKLEIAGLLHDLGKLRVPDGILEKPAKLDEFERMAMNAHSFETMQILMKIKGFEEISCWAAYHHEEPGGGGYPYGLDASNLPLEARILRVADIFQAMVQDRPYRKGLSREAVAAFMSDLQSRGSIDAQVNELLSVNLDEMIALAQGLRAGC
jgi:putative nucleotidyltransferase with HDIG domain